MNSINYRKYATKSAVNYNVLLRIAAIVMAMHIGSTSLRAGCHLDPTATTPPGGVKLQMIAFGDSLLDVGTYQQFAKANLNGGQFTTNPSKIFVEDLACTYGCLLLPAFQVGFRS